jgi:hypothetical protein
MGIEQLILSGDLNQAWGERRRSPFFPKPAPCLAEITAVLNPFVYNYIGIRMISKIETGITNIDSGPPPGEASRIPNRVSMALGNNKVYPIKSTTEINRGTSFD